VLVFDFKNKAISTKFKLYFLFSFSFFCLKKVIFVKTGKSC